jgi:ADP-heptose:LPS heptosyltransferase
MDVQDRDRRRPVPTTPATANLTAMTDPRLVPDVRRIAVLRANALGDLIFALPALDALRAAYPEAEIVLLAREWHQELLEGRPGPVDRVIPLPEGIPPDGAPPLPPDEERRFLDSVAAEGWDLALQMHGGGRHSNPVVAALGARVTAGCRTPDARELDREARYVYFQSEVLRLLEVVGLVGASPVTVEPHLAVTEADRTAAADAAPELVERPFAVLHPGASDPRRRWAAERFAAVGTELTARGLAVAVTGTPGEAELVRRVVDGIEGPAVDLAGRLDLSAVLGLVARAAVVVSNDTGPLHVAAAAGSPTVGIFWCGNAINGGAPFRRRTRLAISWRLDCPVCGVDCMHGHCDHTASFVDDVPVEQVSREAHDLISEPSVSPRRGLERQGAAAR